MGQANCIREGLAGALAVREFLSGSPGGTNPILSWRIVSAKGISRFYLRLQRAKGPKAPGRRDFGHAQACVRFNSHVWRMPAAWLIISRICVNSPPPPHSQSRLVVSAVSWCRSVENHIIPFVHFARLIIVLRLPIAHTYLSKAGIANIHVPVAVDSSVRCVRMRLGRSVNPFLAPFALCRFSCSFCPALRIYAVTGQ